MANEWSRMSGTEKFQVVMMLGSVFAILIVIGFLQINFPSLRWPIFILIIVFIGWRLVVHIKRPHWSMASKEERERWESAWNVWLDALAAFIWLFFFFGSAED